MDGIKKTELLLKVIYPFGLATNLRLMNEINQKITVDDQ